MNMYNLCREYAVFPYSVQYKTTDQGSDELQRHSNQEQ